MILKILLEESKPSHAKIYVNFIKQKYLATVMSAAEQEVVMNKFVGKQAYQNTPVASVRIDDAHTAITLCLETLLHNLKILQEMPECGSELFGKVSGKCLTAIYILQTSLDFEKGREIAENLFKLYEFVKFQVLAQAKKGEDSDIKNAIIVISEISETWKAIK